MIKKVLENLKITALNEMQLAAMDASKKGSDVVLLSPTGSGKTLGFLLPILNLLNDSKAGVQALIIVPSRELALQIEQVFKQMATGYKVNCCYGGHATRVEKNNLEQPPAVLIGTPGRIAFHLRSQSFDPSTIHTLVLDEFDKALEFGFEKDMTAIIEQMRNLKNRILTSATNALTIPPFTGIKRPVVLDYLKDTTTLKGLQLKAVVATGSDKLETLFSLICKLGSTATLVFCNHREAVDRISELLQHKGLLHDVFHGGMEQDERERALIKFRNGSHRILITTDLASRGLDIPEIENVIHYQLPLTENAFVHRNGRTARMHAEGTGYIVLAQDEEQPAYIKEKLMIEQLPASNTLPENAPWVTLYIAAGRKDKINKMDIVGMLIQKGGLQKDELGLIEVLDYSSFAAIKRGRINKVLAAIKNEKIKNRKVKMEVAR
ncbi:MAG: DEAD/DEAH box helicase [Bacteroidia bacterium]